MGRGEFCPGLSRNKKMHDGSDDYENGWEERKENTANECPDCGNELSEGEWLSSDSCPHCGGDLMPF